LLGSRQLSDDRRVVKRADKYPRFTLRMPDDLRRAIEGLAESEERTASNWVIAALRAAVAEQASPPEPMKARFVRAVGADKMARTWSLSELNELIDHRIAARRAKR
jgi:hypothetical protein